MRYQFTGDAAQVYPQYLDVEKGTTLVAEPGQTYDIRQVEGLTVPGPNTEDGTATAVEVKLAIPPDDRWSPEKPPTRTRPARAETSEEN
jgi:hypothetical protein